MACWLPTKIFRRTNERTLRCLFLNDKWSLKRNEAKDNKTLSVTEQQFYKLCVSLDVTAAAPAVGTASQETTTMTTGVIATSSTCISCDQNPQQHNWIMEADQLVQDL